MFCCSNQQSYITLTTTISTIRAQNVLYTYFEGMFDGKKARVSPGDTGGKDIADGTGMMLPHYMTTAKDRKNSRKVMY